MIADDVAEDGRARRVAYWVALATFVLLAAGAVSVAFLAPMRPDEPLVSRVHTVETSTDADGRTTRTERTEETTGKRGGSVLGWTVGWWGAVVLQVTAGLLVAYLISSLVNRVICGHYAVKMVGVELPDQATQIAEAADKASAAANEGRVLAHDTIAQQENLSAGVRSSSEPVDSEVPEYTGAGGIVFGLSDLSVSLSDVLRSLLTPPPRIPVHGTDDMARVLSNRGVLTPQLSAAVGRVVRQCRTAGSQRKRARLDDAAMTYGPALLADLRRLRPTVARAFERHVLDALERVPGWVTERGKVIQGNQVDALARRDGTEVIVEVRSRIGPGATAAIKDTLEWLRGIPIDLPVLLIVPAEPVMTPDWQDIVNRPGLSVLRWDDEHQKLAATLSGMSVG